MARHSHWAVFVMLSVVACGGTQTPASDASADADADAAVGDAGGADADAAVVDAGILPGFGQECRPFVQQSDRVCADGLVCVSVGAQQGSNLCTKTCATEGAACTGGPSGTTPTCGREYQLTPANSRVCEFLCDPGAPNCPPGTSCLVDFFGRTTCQP